MLKWIALAFGLFAASVAAWALWPASTPAITDDGDPVGGSIATLEPVPIGGMEQWLLIRGRHSANPVLLWLHGGPGASEMPVVPHYNRALEEEFVVVHWDQRGAGKSNPRDFDESTMTFERFVQDAHELTRHLKRRFGKKKIYLLGHSWGSHLGLVAVGDARARGRGPRHRLPAQASAPARLRRARSIRSGPTPGSESS